MSAPASPPVAVTAPRLMSLLYPSTLILIAADLLPIVGVLAWGWDAFQLLMLYWMESAIIAFWTVARIATLPPGAMGPLNGRPTDLRLAMTLFFVVFLGFFMAGHLLFLWVMFAHEWSKRIHGLSDFYAQIIVASGLWAVLLTLFVSRGLSFLFHVLKPDFILAIEKRIPIPGLPRPQTGPVDAGGIIGGVLGRIFLMQIAIIFGAYVALLLGAHAAGPLFILVILKTTIDALLHVAVDMRPHPKPAAAAG